MAPTIPSLPLKLFFFFLLSTSALTTLSQPLTISTRLIHRDSYLSPLYNPLETVAQLATRSLQSSLVRHASIPPLNENNNQRRKVEIGLIEAMNHNIFYVNFSIGNPPVPQLVVMDTSSDLLWVKCLPCSPCSPVAGSTLFDPAKSNTFAPRPCDKGCKNDCSVSQGICKYKIDYIGNQTNEGILARERMTFHQFGVGATSNIVVPNLLFGCSNSLKAPEEQIQTFVNGLLPLGFNKGNSLVARFGSKFSYCVGSVVDRSYPYNHLSIGEGAYLAGNSTPIYTMNRGNYFVTMTNISLGGQDLSFGYELYLNTSYKYGVAIDTGVEQSYLYTKLFDVVKAAVSKAALSRLIAVPTRSPYELCYKGSVYREPRGFPTLGLKFERGAELVLDQFGMFKQVEDDVFCFAFLRSTTVSLVGMMAQQGYNVGYDLVEFKVHFSEIDCQVLE